MALSECCGVLSEGWGVLQSAPGALGCAPGLLERSCTIGLASLATTATTATTATGTPPHRLKSRKAPQTFFRFTSQHPSVQAAPTTFSAHLIIPQALSIAGPLRCSCSAPCCLQLIIATRAPCHPHRLPFTCRLHPRNLHSDEISHRPLTAIVDCPKFLTHHSLSAPPTTNQISGARVVQTGVPIPRPVPSSAR